MRLLASVKTYTLALLSLLMLIAGCAATPQSSSLLSSYQPAVASAHPLATEAGMKILAEGGNAFDAAVATAAVLGVVEPYSAGIGGGGFWLLQQADGNAVFVDARETAPGDAHETMYLDADGNVHHDKLSVNGPLAAGIPGQPAAFAHISSRFGNQPLQRSLQTAIDLARDGFPVDNRYRQLAEWRLDVLQRYPTTSQVFLVDNQLPALGALIKQPALARTLATLAQQGHNGFYQGEVATRLAEDVSGAGGLWTVDDLADYRIMERTPILIEHGPYTLWSAPPPSSGGIALAQMFGMMAARPFTPSEANPAAMRVHYLTEMMRRAYRDRALYLGDPDFTDVPTAMLLAPSYLARQASTISMTTATSSKELKGDFSSGTHTTHLSVLDQQGNRVSATLSINLPFGSGFLSASTGVLLNNEMDDFSIKPGTPNAYGLVGGEANKVEPGKRPLSSMTPTLMSGPARSAIIGTPGGSRIITMVYLGLLELMAGSSAEEVVAAPRFHHQYLPDHIQYEPGFLTGSLADDLQAMGHELKDVERDYGNMQLIVVDHQKGTTSAASDPRGIGAARVE
ncbi:MAG: gamma-glutamyltransferase [Marinobacter sp.]|uniref:gamma-glutamyltransferase n=1 Tax=Marinobacter sp. TaxID=50741 RepID=UPI0034A0504D